MKKYGLIMTLLDEKGLDEGLVRSLVVQLYHDRRNTDLLLGHQSKDVRKEAIGVSNNIASVSNLVWDPNPEVQIRAIQRIESLGNPVEIYKDIDSLLKSKDFGVRLSTLWAIKKCPNKRAINPLADYLLRAETNEEIEEIAKTISSAEFSDKILVSPLIGALGDDDAFKERAIVEALVKIGKPAVKPLIGALGDENELTREAAAKALGRIGDPYAVTALRKVAEKDENYYVRSAAKEAIERI